MRARDKVKFAGIGAATLFVATAILLTTGLGQAAAATVTQVFVTNKGATQAVPVSVTNGSVAVSTKPLASTAWFVITACTSTPCVAFTPPAGKSTLALTSLTSSNGDTSATFVEVDLRIGSTNCSSGTFKHVLYYWVPAGDTTHLAFPQPLVVAPGGSNWTLCLVQGATTGASTFVGYYY